MIPRVRRYGQEIHLPNDKSLIRLGEQDVDMFVIVKGAIDVYTIDGNLQRSLIVRHLEREFTGELDLFNSHRTMVHASTAAESTLIRVPRPEMRKLLWSAAETLQARLQSFSPRSLAMYISSSVVHLFRHDVAIFDFAN